MTIETIATIVGILSVLTNGVTVIIVLYVKATVGPIVAELKNHSELLTQHRKSKDYQANAITEIKERLAHVEALTNGKG